MKFVKNIGKNPQLEEGRIYQVARRTLKGEYILKGIEGRFLKEEFEPVKTHQGTAIYMPKVGEPFKCDCYEKSHKVVYETTPVVEIHKKGRQYIVHTQNSVYIIFVLLE